MNIINLIRKNIQIIKLSNYVPISMAYITIQGYNHICLENNFHLKILKLYFILFYDSDEACGKIRPENQCNVYQYAMNFVFY